MGPSAMSYSGIRGIAAAHSSKVVWGSGAAVGTGEGVGVGVAVGSGVAAGAAVAAGGAAHGVGSAADRAVDAAGAQAGKSRNAIGSNHHFADIISLLSQTRRSFYTFVLYYKIIHLFRKHRDFCFVPARIV